MRGPREESLEVLVAPPVLLIKRVGAGVHVVASEGVAERPDSLRQVMPRDESFRSQVETAERPAETNVEDDPFQCRWVFVENPSELVIDLEKCMRRHPEIVGTCRVSPGGRRRVERRGVELPVDMAVSGENDVVRVFPAREMRELLLVHSRELSGIESAEDEDADGKPDTTEREPGESAGERGGDGSIFRCGCFPVEIPHPHASRIGRECLGPMPGSRNLRDVGRGETRPSSRDSRGHNMSTRRRTNITFFENLLPTAGSNVPTHSAASAASNRVESGARRERSAVSIQRSAGGARRFAPRSHSQYGPVSSTDSISRT